MVLSGQQFRPNDVIPLELAEELKTNNVSRFASLMRVGHLIEVSDSLLSKVKVVDAPVEAVVAVQSDNGDEAAGSTEAAVVEGDMCLTCGKGPFQRLNSHMTKAHS